MDYQTSAIYGNAPNPSYLGASMMNPAYAQSETDWGAVLTNGIRGAAEGAMSVLVAEKYASGQLQNPQQYQQQKSMMPLVILGAIVYVLMKAD